MRNVVTVNLFWYKHLLGKGKSFMLQKQKSHWTQMEHLLCWVCCRKIITERNLVCEWYTWQAVRYSLDPDYSPKESLLVWTGVPAYCELGCVRGHSSKLSFPNNHTPSHTPSVTCSVIPSNTPNSVNTPYIPPHRRQLHPCWTITSPSLSVTLCDYLRDYLHHGLRHVLYYSIVLLLSLFSYLYNLTLILAEVLSYSFRTSC